MFNKEKNSISNEKQAPGSATLISEGTTLHGDVESATDLRIDGTIKGNVKSSAKIIVGPTGFINGNIEGNQADITGKVDGHIVVKELLQLRGQCNVTGNISASKLQIEPTAVFNGQCQMNGGTVSANNIKANIVQMTSDVAPTAEAK